MLFRRNATPSKTEPADEQPLYVFVLSYNRPIYLWCALDSLFRTTKQPVRFVIADNNSTDPLVKDVIRGFERRGMFHAVHYCEDNRPDRVGWMIRQHREGLGEFFGFVESDVIVLDSEEGWLSTMLRLMKANPKLYMLGSRALISDFVDRDYAHKLEPEMSEEQLEFLIKAHSPERQPIETQEELIEPHNPPGRLLLFRTDILSKVPIKGDYQIYASLKEIGLEAKIATAVKHRHLSLLNFYDYFDYDAKQRAAFFVGVDSTEDVIDASPS